MIVVIADDLSGAAELAGVACARGLSAEVQTVFDPETGADLVAVDTDTRSGNADSALQRVDEMTRRVLAARPEWIYKKTDSVLRGHIRAEITAMLSATGSARALFLPANPARGRTIREGCYLVNGTPLDQTLFARDPEYPATSSGISEILERASGEELRVLGSSLQFPSQGIIVPDASNSADLTRWAAQADESTLCAGAAEFFDALLETRTGRACQEIVNSLPGTRGSTLFVCGSLAAWPVRRWECKTRGIPVVAMPSDLISSALPPQESDLAAWAAETAVRIAEAGCAMIAIGEAPVSSLLAPGLLVEILARTTEKVLQIVSVERVLLEGGATAAAFLRRMRATRLAVHGQIEPGLPAFQLLGNKAPLLAIKPGSYSWPASVWPVRG